jgi:PKD repeat protein
MLASNAVNRVYHSTSLLLPDGRVLHTGSGGASGAVDELNAELFSPPYLFKGPRPTITDAPTAVGYTIPFRVQTPQFATVSKVSLIRMASVTHAFDQNGRFQWLTFTRDAGGLIVKAPTKYVRTPAGYYMLFVLDNGVPSVAKIVKVGNQSGQPAPTPNAAPVANFDFTCNDLSCNFTDSSTDSDGTVAAWSWSFGDNGTSTTRNPSRTYASPGNYSVTLTVTDNKGGTDQHNVLVTVPTGTPVNAPPTASFTNGCTQLACTFTDGSTDTDGTVTGWSWDFGDNTSDNVANPSHTYATGGTYTVTLVATDNGGATATTSKTITVAVTVPNAAPKAKFAVTCNALVCRLSSLSSDTDGTVVAMNWTFGDASSMATTDINIRHTYAASGSYAVTLQVTDDDGATAQTSKTIPITSAITLNATGQADATQQTLTLTWSGASGTTVDVYQNRALLKQEPNDGLYTFSRPLPGLSKYTFSVCQVGSTTMCSNEATVTF